MTVTSSVLTSAHCLPLTLDLTGAGSLAVRGHEGGQLCGSTPRPHPGCCKLTVADVGLGQAGWWWVGRTSPVAPGKESL